jgi:hypothetical protein
MLYNESVPAFQSNMLPALSGSVKSNRNKKWQLTQHLLNLESFICDAMDNVDISKIFGVVKLSCDKVFQKQKSLRIKKFQCLLSKKNTIELRPSEKFVINCVKSTMSDSELALLNKGMNYSVSFTHSNLGLTCTGDSSASNLTPAIGMKFRWRIGAMSENTEIQWSA